MKQTEFLIQKISAEFSEFAIDPSGLFLLDSVHAVQLILRGTQGGLELQGVESFWITPEGAFQPEQRFSNDIADERTGQEEFVEMTIALVEQGGLKGVKFQVIFA